MMQSFGYLLAATGPIFMGVLYQISGAWTFGLAVMILISGVQILAGLGAAKSGTA
jgi:CP family cyanate transporter-like MFS transporter